MSHKVYVGVPTYDHRWDFRTFIAIQKCSKTPGTLAEIRYSRSGILPFGFNMLLTQGLNARSKGVTHFLMIHSDIIPTQFGWLDEMLKIMEQTKADALSVVSPIKDERGVTSTGIDKGEHTIKRFTMHEIMQMPETFTMEHLAVNTGLLLIDLSKDWVAKCPFDFEQTIKRAEDGSYYPSGLSEDWLWSRNARKLGATLYATRAIHIEHVGMINYSNQKAWGWKTDEAYKGS